ncbi:MAG: metallophosphoesterase [Bacteroidetes bacterium]|jgi:Icc-related predicted phosphoesterase|nr:metallophosphoesterase [Bacteroidota bacterium]
MKFVAISDTHGLHESLVLPKGDVLLHAGDISSRGTKAETEKFLDWFSSLNFKYKIFIAGNHDFFFEEAKEEEIKAIIPDNVIYLNDWGVEIEGIRIWGSPITPWFYDWAFNRDRGAEITKHWDLIPSDTNILITHGPVANILDKTVRNQHAGCEDLKRKIEEINPAFHICGHIHEAYGQVTSGKTTYINASVLDVNYRLKNAPVCFDFEQ